MEHSQRLIDAIAETLPGHLEERVSELGIDAHAVSETIEQVTARAVSDLAEVLEMPFEAQSRTPLEVLRGAVVGLGQRLLELGADPPERDPEQARLAPDDPFGLAPASAAELGAEALEASLAWGLAKTRAITRPLVLVVTSNLMDASRLESGGAAAGYRVEVRRDAEFDSIPLVAFVDLEHSGSDETIRVLAEEGVRVIAYGPHVDDLALVRARTLGATSAEPRSRVLRDPAAFLPPLV